MTAAAALAITGEARLRLARGVRLRHDAVRHQTVLLAPERAMALDQIAVRIVEALDGVRSLDSIIDGLAEAFNAPREQIAADVTAFVSQLSDRRLLEAAE